LVKKANGIQLKNEKGTKEMYSIPKTGEKLFFIGGMGLIGFMSNIILFFVIFGIFITVISLLNKRIALEPVHHSDGKYHLAITKNGQAVKWLWKKHR